ncbi:hypothetical protein BV22DRAFT_1135746 [Leucogyrophana mollusca]|uniref:Uncharacterized protein n=1 Tax=Leucogyrophana mollusca TaxID=85980 RepID=A0ACB8AV56_9AGAM|nr:hypothetical protein BV22DRAFT_1135746 [Leucogyrophana mollusca]
MSQTPHCIAGTPPAGQPARDPCRVGRSPLPDHTLAEPRLWLSPWSSYTRATPPAGAPPSPPMPIIVHHLRDPVHDGSVPQAFPVRQGVRLQLSALLVSVALSYALRPAVRPVTGEELCEGGDAGELEVWVWKTRVSIPATGRRWGTLGEIALADPKWTSTS